MNEINSEITNTRPVFFFVKQAYPIDATSKESQILYCTHTYTHTDEGVKGNANIFIMPEIAFLLQQKQIKWT